MRKKENELLFKPIDLTPKRVIKEDEYEKLLEYKFRYLELKELVEKIIKLKGDTNGKC